MPKDYIHRTVQAYNLDPERYEAATKSMVLLPELDEFVSYLPTTDAPILDAGCAFGRDAVLFEKRGFKVIGIDMSDKLLSRARELYPKLIFKKMDIRNLQFEDESFVGVWCHATLLHLTDEDIRTALKELKRVLMPQGVLFVSFKEGTGQEELLEKFTSSSARFFNYQTVETTNNLLKEAGLMRKKTYIINERKKFGADKRDLNWIYCFALK